MTTDYRMARLVVEIAPELRRAVEAEAERRSAVEFRRVTVSDVVRDLIASQLFHKVGDSQ